MRTLVDCTASFQYLDIADTAHAIAACLPTRNRSLNRGVPVYGAERGKKAMFGLLSGMAYRKPSGIVPFRVTPYCH
ncbi:hypothetical protein J1614_000522 [Plenodomus biglobosus]|nr:hypothetical protein J1614_000522 [Plenodomus biglobosus]